MVLGSEKRREDNHRDNNKNRCTLKLGKIRQMEGGVDPQGGLDPQSGHHLRGPELDIPPLQTKIPSQIMGVQFEYIFFEPMMTESTFTQGPSTHPSYIDPSFSRLAFTEPTYTEIPPPQTPPTPDHAPWMDLLAKISSLGTCIEEFAVVSNTCFYSMEDRMDQYQIWFTFQFEYLQQRIDRFEDRMEHQHDKMMVYLCFVFPSPPPQS